MACTQHHFQGLFSAQIGGSPGPSGTPPPPLAKFWSAAPSIINSYIPQNRCWKVAFNHLISPPPVMLPALPQPYPLLAELSSLAGPTVEGGKQRNQKTSKGNIDTHSCLNHSLHSSMIIQAISLETAMIKDGNTLPNSWGTLKKIVPSQTLLKCCCSLNWFRTQ